MRRETVLVAGFVGFVVLTAGLIWAVALPNLKPLHVPQIVSGEMQIGTERVSRPLDASQVSSINHWLAQTRRDWGPLGGTPPSSGDAVLTLHPQSGADYTLTLWLGLSAGDWNDVAALQRVDRDKPRSATLGEDEFAIVRHIVQPDPLPQGGP